MTNNSRITVVKNNKIYFALNILIDHRCSEGFSTYFLHFGPPVERVPDTQSIASLWDSQKGTSHMLALKASIWKRRMKLRLTVLFCFVF